MDIDRYKILLTDDAVFKITLHNDKSINEFLFTPEDGTYLSFLFIISNGKEDNPPTKRISIHPYSLPKTTDGFQKLKQENILLVDFEDPIYAMSFELIADFNNRLVSVKLLDEAELYKEHYITQEERDGIWFEY
jgi:hypothetical protein